MTDKPLVSVIVPVYNGEKYIAETIQSALDQTYKNLEIIVVDDGSTDSTADIVKSFNDERIIYLHQQNSGANVARNYGINASKGEFIAPLDADDIWLPHKIEAQVNEFSKDPEIGLVYSWVYFMDPEGKILSKKEIRVQGDHYLSLLTSNYLICGSITLIKKECFEKVGYFGQSTDACQEWELGLRIARKYKFGCVQDYVCKYRIHPESESRVSRFYKKIKEQGGAILDRELAQGYPGLDRVKSKICASRYIFLAGLCINHRDYKEGLYNLYSAVKARPAVLLERKPIILLIKFLLSPILKK